MSIVDILLLLRRILAIDCTQTHILAIGDAASLIPHPTSHTLRSLLVVRSVSSQNAPRTSAPHAPRTSAPRAPHTMHQTKKRERENMRIRWNGAKKAGWKISIFFLRRSKRNHSYHAISHGPGRSEMYLILFRSPPVVSTVPLSLLLHM